MPLHDPEDPRVIERLRSWTFIDDDLTDCDPKVREVFRRTRITLGLGDIDRSTHWSDPDGVRVIPHIPYIEDGKTEHTLNIYLPEDAILRHAHVPVILEIHGGGFTYGLNTLNRNYATRLATRGMAVFSINYRMAPAATFPQQIEDALAATRWILDHATEYPVDPHALYVAGDSAGATIGLYLLLAATRPEFRSALALPEVDASFRGGLFVSGLFNLEPLIDLSRESIAPHMDLIAKDFFPETMRALPSTYRNLATLSRSIPLPPLFLCTSSDDFLEHESLELAAGIAERGGKLVIRDIVPKKGEPLGHVFPVGMSWLPESRTILDDMAAFIDGEM